MHFLLDIKSVVRAVIAVIALGSLSVILRSSPAGAQTYRAAKTPDGIHRIAVIIIPNGRLFKSANGDNGADAGLMEVYFILEGGGEGDRIPVTRDPNSPTPAGWLAKGSFEEWNSTQMVDFAPQGGRDLVDVFNDPKCAVEFALSGKT